MIKKSTLFYMFLLVSLLGCSENKTLEIENVLLRDALIPYQVKDNENKSQYIVEKMRSIDLSGTPVAFRNAYQDHIIAWEKSVEALQTNNSEIEKEASNDIAKTFEVVKSMALNNNARLPPDSLRTTTSLSKTSFGEAITCASNSKFSSTILGNYQSNNAPIPKENLSAMAEITTNSSTDAIRKGLDKGLAVDEIIERISSSEIAIGLSIRSMPKSMMANAMKEVINKTYESCLYKYTNRKKVSKMT